jgi:hypothetical protein
VVTRGHSGPDGQAGHQTAERLGKGAWLRLGRRGLPNPHQHSAALIYGQPFGLDEFVLEGLKLVIIQAELHFEGPIRHAPLALHQFRHLDKDGIKIYY